MSVTASGSRPVDRRRRMMALEPDQNVSEIDEQVEMPTAPASGTGAAFEGLSRDRLIRRIITPRLWKLVLLGSTLTVAPLLLLVLQAFGGENSPASRFLTSSLPTAFSGIQLLLAGQLCWLIACVRSASAVDYRGGYRSWKRLSWFLGALAVLVLSQSANQSADELASVLAGYIGNLQSARPALLLVPAASLLAWILRTVIPDMGRCRPAQSLLSVGTVLGLVYVVLSIRRHPEAEALSAGIPLMASGVILSALLLHTRYVIYVNPNPPEKCSKPPVALRIVEPARETIDTQSIETRIVKADSQCLEAEVPVVGADAGQDDTASEPEQDERSSRKNEKTKGKNRRKAG